MERNATLDLRGYARHSEGPYWILTFHGREVGASLKSERQTLAEMVSEYLSINDRIASGDVEWAEAS